MGSPQTAAALSNGAKPQEKRPRYTVLVEDTGWHENAAPLQPLCNHLLKITNCLWTSPPWCHPTAQGYCQEWWFANETGRENPTRLRQAVSGLWRKYYLLKSDPEAKRVGGLDVSSRALQPARKCFFFCFFSMGFQEQVGHWEIRHGRRLQRIAAGKRITGRLD